ncbi:hypothetical protein A9P82_12660 [Arachidicoccus ginsenosidimutans]|uniref:FecR family protein n=1 Tax=Arachidicoccus sp. BS20 TaxID=1850526 RepID=UPI0007F11FED|nr:FecR family protein [Arachidicoccus sp. BS20]ANI90060.1 hypothetical protein A9P82_12660 [Arachidicoccus sp. BS20]
MNFPSSKKLKYWAENYLKGTISQSDKEALEAWYMSMPDMEIDWDDDQIDSLQTLQHKIFKAVESQIRDNDNKKILRRKRLRYIMSAAAIIFILVTLGFFMHKGKNTEIASAGRQLVNDIQPGITQATLTLPNGKKIALDSAHSVKITAEKGSIYVVDKNGVTTYLGNATQLNVYNTLTTHRGEQAPPLVLADGTKVWLNSASSLRFPISFNSDTREVTLSGEAYFEVAKNPRHPFIVNAGASKIKVLGTHFDVMAYKDEPYTCATLLEGSIRITNGNNNARLVPGQQGKISTDGSVNVGWVDAEESIAWLHGQLSMKSMNLTTFMREVSRWYNVDVVYEGEPPVLNFSGLLNKAVPLSQILAALSANGVRCNLKDKTIIVSGK